MCSPDLTKETTLVEGDQIIVGPVQIPYLPPPSTNLERWGITLIAAIATSRQTVTKQDRTSYHWVTSKDELQRSIFLHIVHLKRGEWGGLTPTRLSWLLDYKGEAKVPCTTIMKIFSLFSGSCPAFHPSRRANQWKQPEGMTPLLHFILVLAKAGLLS